MGANTGINWTQRTQECHISGSDRYCLGLNLMHQPDHYPSEKQHVWMQRNIKLDLSMNMKQPG